MRLSEFSTSHEEFDVNQKHDIPRLVKTQNWQKLFLYLRFDLRPLVQLCKVVVVITE